MTEKDSAGSTNPDFDWSASVRMVEGGVLAGFAVLLLAVAVAVLGISGTNLNVVELSKWGAITAGMLQIRASVLATCLVALAGRRLLDGSGQGAAAGGARSLRAARKLVAIAWLLGLAMVSLPLMMELPLHVPETGLVFGLLLLAGAAQVAVGAMVYRSLVSAVAAQADAAAYELSL
ncbi:hypothetical protein [Lysobacter sp. Root983]|uniref:hypothetical protein n=1 Tax=Lysobacter sp. Root983 TaxID=1736613 RepID=UPI00070EFC80|nr:hypothetical protein [Lysobacter sp. Root983]KRD80046.1 hypothetical protein ASE43_03950 [Lysobacter sp. Root983]